MQSSSTFILQEWIQAMVGITIRKLDDRLKLKLRVRAAENGRSMAEEVLHLASVTEHVCVLSRTSGRPPVASPV